ncbi:MAG: flagellar basal body rod protein FlgC [Armatimonadetes bacterium]|nr:flagellar basal body rod protein FlgC [Armatimonadota bacterium]
MSLFGGLRISASALTVERLRMNTIAENIANADTTRTPQGGPYRRQEVVVAQAAGGGFGAAAPDGSVQAVAIVPDPRPDRMLLDPSHPDADANGYVRMPNVELPMEMVDLMAASRAYEINATAFATQRRSQERTLELVV